MTAMATKPGFSKTPLIERLPAVRGRLTENAPMSGVTWFRVGGPAEVMFKPADEEDLAAFLAGCPDDVPITVIGVASNLLVRDGGVPGVVIRLGRAFVEIEAKDDRVVAGAAALDVNVAKVAGNAGLAGLEFLVGIPGTIGGALRMNGGAYGTEMKDVLESAWALDRQGKRLELSLAEMDLTYRHCGVAEDVVFGGAVLRAEPGDKRAIAARMTEISEARGTTQPIRSRTGGSTFANPPGHKAWQVIDEAGCRGLRLGGAQVSELHCNFLINTGDATASDLESLGETVRDRVREKHGIELRWEIRRIGVPASDQDQNGGQDG